METGAGANTRAGLLARTSPTWIAIDACGADGVCVHEWRRL
jgi:hypothetical protein